MKHCFEICFLILNQTIWYRFLFFFGGPFLEQILECIWEEYPDCVVVRGCLGRGQAGGGQSPLGGHFVRKIFPTPAASLKDWRGGYPVAYDHPATVPFTSIRALLTSK